MAELRFQPKQCDYEAYYLNYSIIIKGYIYNIIFLIVSDTVASLVSLGRMFVSEIGGVIAPRTVG